MTRRDFDMDDALDAAEPLLEKLTRFWMDERNAPEILEWQGLVVDEVLNKLHAQVHAHTLSYGAPTLMITSLLLLPYCLKLVAGT